MPHEIVSFDDEAMKGYVGKLVAKTVEEMFLSTDVSPSGAKVVRR